ncbi:MAG: TonB-dependent receptor [Bacteroidota bacterium]|nr:TonB-dependent receptor [Bacteroidota bacterium]
MFRIIFLTTIFILNQSFAAEQSASDSSKIYYLKPYTITATGFAIPINESPSSIELITREQISRSNASTLADVLQNASSIFIKDYGTAGGLKTLSIRGTAAEHNLILINGSKINNFQNGLVDLSLMPVENIEKVEIVQGGNSALYGSDAIGGVVNILTTKSSDDRKINLSGTKGSFNYNKYQFGYSDRLPGQIGLTINYVNEYGDDNYKYRVIDSNPDKVGTKNRENAEYKRHNIYLSTDYDYDKTNLQLASSYTNSSRGIPGSLAFPSLKANQADKAISGQFIINNSSLNNINIKLSSNVYFSHQKYTDADWLINSFSKNLHYNINPQFDYTINQNIFIASGGEYAEGKLEGVDYISKIKRQQKSIYLTSNINYEIESDYFKKINLYPTLRYDKYSGFDGELIPKIGFNSTLHADIYFRTSYGINYRIPTLNDLYYIDGWGNLGNNKLKPEYSKAFDIGINKSFNIFGRLIIDGSYFKIDTRDKIIWMPTPMWTYSPVNIGKVSTKGYSLKLNWILNKYIQFEGNYTNTDSRKRNAAGDNDPTFDKQIVYTPKSITKLGLNLNYEFVSFNLYQQYVSERFADEANTKSLSPYSVISGNLSLNYKTNYGNYSAKFEMNNMLEKVYQVIADYPMPLRNYRFTLGMEY